MKIKIKRKNKLFSKKMKKMEITKNGKVVYVL